MKNMVLTAALLVLASISASAEVSPPVPMPTDGTYYQLKVISTAQDTLAGISDVEKSLEDFGQSRNGLNACHTIGSLHSKMLYMASWATHGPSTAARIKGINEIMPFLADINTFCRMKENLKAPWNARTDIRNIPDVTIRLERIKLITTRIANGQLR